MSSALEKRKLGKTGIDVTPLGFGAMHINDNRLNETEVNKLLNEVLDLGINLIDTARSYGLSEERIGRHLSHRRAQFVLSTKVGYGVPGFQDWTYDCILSGVERALQTMNCDYLDIVHLHSCPMNTLLQGEVMAALQACKDSGKIRAAAYSGDNEELGFAIKTGNFDSVQFSLNLCDQMNAFKFLDEAQEKELGVLIKRPLASSAWKFNEKPGSFAEATYWERFKVLKLPFSEAEMAEKALRFSAFYPGVSSSLVGSSHIESMKKNVTSLSKGPLESAELETIRKVFLQALK